MTTEQLNQKYSALTGIRANISELISNATTDEEKKKVYDHLMWHIKNGEIRKVDGIKELVTEVIPALAEALSQNSTAEVVEEPKYTAAEAAAYNLTLEGALAYGAVKTPAVDAVEAKPAIYSFKSFNVDTNAPYGTGTVKVINQDLQDNVTTVEVLTNEPAGNTTAEEATEFVGKQYFVHDTVLEANKHYSLYTGILTPIYVTVELVSEAVEAVEAKAAVLYTNEEVDAYNAKLTGAKHKGDPKPAQNQEG